MKISILLFYLAIPIVTNALTLSLQGVAKNQNGEVVYIEKHTIQKDSNGLSRFIKVEYTKPNGVKFAEMVSDFSQSKILPETVFQDNRFKMKSTIMLKNNNVHFEEIRNDKPFASKVHNFKVSMVASQGFDNFIKMNSDKFVVGPVEFKFGVIDTQDFYSLIGFRKSSKYENEVEYTIQASNWFARLFAGELKVVYDSKKMKIVSYAGRSNILDDQGNSQNVLIEYKWSDGT